MKTFFFSLSLQMTSANPNQFGAPMDQNQYMEQEEEWEREGLLDPAWEKQQRKVYEESDPFELLQLVLVLAIIGNLNTYICRF